MCRDIQLEMEIHPMT